MNTAIARLTDEVKAEDTRFYVPLFPLAHLIYFEVVSMSVRDEWFRNIANKQYRWQKPNLLGLTLPKWMQVFKGDRSAVELTPDKAPPTGIPEQWKVPCVYQ